MDVVVGQFENASGRDFKAVMDAYADDVVLAFHGDSRGIGGDGAVGKTAVGEWFAEWFGTFDPDYRIEVEEARDLGDRVLIVATHRGRGRASGAPITQRAGWVYTVRSGKVIRCDVYPDRHQALAAVGLAE